MQKGRENAGMMNSEINKIQIMADKVVDNSTKFLHGLLNVENLSNLKVKQQNLEKGKQFNDTFE